jgi:hypothetical protein
MPEYKPTGPVIKFQSIEPQEGIKTEPETLAVKNTIEAQQDIISPQGSDDKKVASITKRIDNLNNIEKTRKELGLSDLKKEETEIITRQKLKLQEELTGMKPQAKEIETDKYEVENKNIDEVGKDILLDPDKTPTQKTETKEVIPFDVRKVYSAVENMLTVFDSRARKIGGFDIMPQQSFDSFVDLYNFMQEKIIGKEQGDAQVNLDFTITDEVNKEMIEKFEAAMGSLEITPTDGWQSSGSQEEYRKDMENIRDVMGSMSQELAPLANELKKGPYSGSASSLESAAEKTNNLAELFNHKAETFQEYMGR